jgi:retron-type reverse transcriptase
VRRVADLYDQIADYDNLCEAFRKAAKGKQNRPEVIAFRQDFTANIQNLRGQLLSHNFDIGHYRFFKVFDPKPRSICAAAFPERVLHHAIMNICEPVLNAYAIHDSYACQRNKGNRKALAKAQKYARRYDWYLKLDIHKYFDSIDHDIMLNQMSRRFKDNELSDMFRQLLGTYHTAPGKGMPIGNLISQHLANFYLGFFDHWIKEERRVHAYLRYMDDFILFGNGKTYLKAELALIKEFLSIKLKLSLKTNIQLNRCKRGIPFLGYRIFPYIIRLSPYSRKRFVHKFRMYEKKWRTEEWSMADLVRHMEPLVEFTRAADTLAFRRSVIKQYGVSS